MKRSQSTERASDLDTSEVRHLRQLEEENLRLKRGVADLTLGRRQRRKWLPAPASGVNEHWSMVPR